MSPERHQQIREIFDKVLERPENHRLEFLHEISGGDHEAFQAVERLLEAGSESSFLDRTSPRTRRFGRYVISRELGRGAMGVVYEAADPLIGRAVAIKVILLDSLSQPDDHASTCEQLFREARSAGSLSHPGIVTIFDVGQQNDVAFVAMEYVDGFTLQQMLASSRRFDAKKSLDILRQAAAALDYAHRNGVIHRDVKPANIMVHEDTTVKITDFGIAKVVAGGDYTRTGLVMGTPSHMSPEQMGGKSLDGRSDQFSLAAVAFQLLTGTEPFWADSLGALLQKILYEPRPSARALNPALPPGVDRVLQRGLEKAPTMRYGSCTEFVSALESAIGDTPSRVTPLQRESVVEAPPVLAEATQADSAGATGRHYWHVLSWGTAIAIIVVFAVLFYFRGIPRWGQTTSGSPPAAAKTAPAPAVIKMAGVKPSAFPTAPVLPTRGNSFGTDDSVKVLPEEDKSARARHIYELAIKFREAHRMTEALDSFRQAADYGEVRAMVELGETFMNDGEGVNADYHEAFRWLRRAAAAGDASGMVDLGGMYLLGNGVDEDFETAAQWFRKGAEAGNATAVYNLATMYEMGRGVVKNHDKAEQLYSQAASLGNHEALMHLANAHH